MFKLYLWVQVNGNHFLFNYRSKEFDLCWYLTIFFRPLNTPAQKIGLILKLSWDMSGEKIETRKSSQSFPRYISNYSSYSSFFWEVLFLINFTISSHTQIPSLVPAWASLSCIYTRVWFVIVTGSRYWQNINSCQVFTMGREGCLCLLRIEQLLNNLMRRQWSLFIFIRWCYRWDSGTGGN